VSAMSFEQFQSSMTVIEDTAQPGSEKLLCYGGCVNQLGLDFNAEETLYIVSREDGTFYLQIGNMEYASNLLELEHILYKWAVSEYWMT
jgi:hypothetical protein